MRHMPRRRCHQATTPDARPMGSRSEQNGWLGCPSTARHTRLAFGLPPGNRGDAAVKPMHKPAPDSLLCAGPLDASLSVLASLQCVTRERKVLAIFGETIQLVSYAVSVRERLPPRTCSQSTGAKPGLHSRFGLQ